jgi:hypothetical protein
MTASVEIVEVGPRDGLQSEPGVFPTAAKIEFIERLFEAGLRRVEVTSFVNPKKVPQMADAEAVLAGLRRRDGVRFIGLVLNRRGYERAAAAGCNEIGMAVVASDTFNRRNQGVSTDESIAAWLEIAREANAAGVRPTSRQFGSMYRRCCAPAPPFRICAARAPNIWWSRINSLFSGEVAPPWPSTTTRWQCPLLCRPPLRGVMRLACVGHRPLPAAAARCRYRPNPAVCLCREQRPHGTCGPLDTRSRTVA